MIFGAFERLSSSLTCHRLLPLVLDITRASLYIFSRWLDGKMGTKMSRQPAQLKTKFLSFYEQGLMKEFKYRISENSRLHSAICRGA